jgi:predicted homoserine dehydrogenase-like protein
VLSVQALGLTGSDDPTELAVAAEQGRILVTQDVQTVTRFAFERVDAGLPMPGVIEVVAGASLGAAIDDLALAVQSHDHGELEGQIIYLPP